MSEWFNGLKYAEKVGKEVAELEHDNYCFDDGCKDFDNGVLDYIRHAERLEQLRELDK